MPESVLICGAGYVGLELARRLQAAGHRVCAIRRSRVPPVTGIHFVRGNVLERATFEHLPFEPKVLVYAVSADQRNDAAYRRAYIEGLDATVSHPRIAASVRRIVFVSSTAVYGQTDGSWVDETSPTEPTGFNGRVMLEAERQLAQQRGTTCLRFGGIYGPGRTRLLERIVADELPGGGAKQSLTRFTNRIHRDDCARAIEHLIALEQPNALYLGVDDEPSRLFEVVQYVRARLGRPLLDEPNTPRGGKRCSNARLRASGFEPIYPTFREGYNSLLATVTGFETR